MSSDSPRPSPRRWLEDVVATLDQQAHLASQAADSDRGLSDSHVELLRPILHDMRSMLESDQGNNVQRMLGSLVELRRSSAPISGFRHFTRTVTAAILNLAGSNGAVPAEVTIDTVDIDLEESPNTVVNQDPISNTYRGTYKGRTALFKQYRALESHSRQGIDVGKVAITQTLLRSFFPGFGLVPLFGIWQPNQGFNHRTFLVEESTPGSVDLANYLFQNPGVDHLLLLKDVVEACACLHLNHLVLGPLTQQSITVSPDGRAYLCNFDYLRFEDPPTPFTPMIASLDSIRWMAPEVMQSFKEERETSPAILTKATDVYALGCLMLWLLTGRKPFAEYTQYPYHLHALVTAATEGGRPQGPADVSAQELGLTADMWTAIGACCARNPADRPSTSDIIRCSFLNDLVDNRLRN